MVNELLVVLICRNRLQFVIEQLILIFKTFLECILAKTSINLLFEWCLDNSRDELIGVDKHFDSLEDEPEYDK